MIRHLNNQNGVDSKIMSFKLKQIGVIRTPYTDNTPYQPVEEAECDFRIVFEPQYTDRLYKLARFHYIYVIYYMHRIKRELSMIVSFYTVLCYFKN